jgi:hypothetical protein
MGIFSSSKTRYTNAEKKNYYKRDDKSPGAVHNITPAMIQTAPCRHVAGNFLVFGISFT